MSVYDEPEYALDVPPRRRTNPLLVRHVTGKSKATTYQLPPPTFYYGYRAPLDAEGVRECVGSWNETKSPPPKEPGVDFVRSNKFAIQKGATTATHIKEFRKSVDIRQKEERSPSKLSRSAEIPPDMTFGITNKPSTPIFDVLNNGFQRSFILEQRQRKEQEALEKKQKQHKHPSQHTKASLGHTKVEHASPKPAFKLPRFTRVPPRIYSHFESSQSQSLLSQSQSTQPEQQTQLPQTQQFTQELEAQMTPPQQSQSQPSSSAPKSTSHLTSSASNGQLTHPGTAVPRPTAEILVLSS